MPTASKKLRLPPSARPHGGCKTTIALQLYKTLQLRATARDRGGGLPVAIAGTGRDP